MKKYFSYFLISITIAVLLVIASELIAFAALEKKYNRKFDKNLLVPMHYFYSTGMMPNFVTTCWNTSFSTNAFGFRTTRAFNPKKKSWLFIGDSVTQGVGVEDDQVFVSQLAKEIDSVNVLNCSLIGWSISDYKNVLQYLLENEENISIQRVTIGWCLNDIYANNGSKNLPQIGNTGWKRLISDWLNDSSSLFKLIKLFVTRNSSNYFEYDKQFYDNPLFLRESKQILQEIQNLCKANSIELDVIVFPYKSQLTNTKPCPTEKLFNQLDINRINGLREFLAEDHIRKSSIYQFSDEIHFNEIGHVSLSTFLRSRL